MASEAKPKKLATELASSAKVIESEDEPRKLAKELASSARVIESEALSKYEFPAEPIRPLKGAAENGEKPNMV